MVPEGSVAGGDGGTSWGRAGDLAGQGQGGPAGWGKYLSFYLKKGSHWRFGGLAYCF